MSGRSLRRTAWRWTNKAGHNKCRLHPRFQAIYSVPGNFPEGAKLGDGTKAFLEMKTLAMCPHLVLNLITFHKIRNFRSLVYSIQTRESASMVLGRVNGPTLVNAGR